MPRVWCWSGVASWPKISPEMVKQCSVTCNEQYFSVWRVSAQSAECFGDGWTPVLLMNGILPQLPRTFFSMFWQNDSAIITLKAWMNLYFWNTLIFKVHFIFGCCMHVRDVPLAAQVSCREGRPTNGMRHNDQTPNRCFSKLLLWYFSSAAPTSWLPGLLKLLASLWWAASQHW